MNVRNSSLGGKTGVKWLPCLGCKSVTSLSPEALAVKAAVQRITGFCKEWNADSRILTDPLIDPNTGKFHFAVKVGGNTELHSPSPVDAAEILAWSNDELWKKLSYWSGEKIKRSAA
jgi:hypothetical protein